jgi:hypothetical protein
VDDDGEGWKTSFFLGDGDGVDEIDVVDRHRLVII